ncbi:ABC transporter substrate-binding protein [Marivirga sp.]|uniref:ABC transporter substrate-binding protein n=1 Tax=Marivirga sp. TaxID=2018662 RepID=UPI002D80EB20|nr:ABC transporter substrate-binding protein [Marivirga sp.]HET8858300.1 ABC transporter substrate-binding protein [Marivirga sp.]
MKLHLSLLILFLFVFGCKKAEQSSSSIKGEELMQYSSKLSIEKMNDYYKVEVLNPNSSDSSSFTYILYKNEKPEIIAAAFLQIPIQSAVCLSTSHLPPFSTLGKSQTLIGFPNTDLIYNKELLKLVNKGRIADVGRKNGVNIEKVMELMPDLIMAYSLGSSMEQLKPLQKAGIPIILNTDYLENSPLGRAEWLKLTAVLVDQYATGDSLFKSIEASYLETKSMVENIEDKPTVMTGLMYGDIWYVPGGDSFAAKFIEDAGGNYLWSENAQTGSLELSFESVLSKAQNANFWIGAASFRSLKELKNSNNKYALFDAFYNQNVYSYTKRVNEEGANDFLESGFMRADWVLKDYVNLLHPTILKDSTTIYFEVLNP